MIEELKIDRNASSRTGDLDEVHVSKRLRTNDDKPVSWKIDAVLGSEYMNGISFRKAFALSVKEKRTISSIVKALDKIFPLKEEDRFLKRVNITNDNSISILIHILSSKSDNSSVEDFKSKNKTQLIEIMKRSDSDIFPTNVPSCAPKTRAQFEMAKLMWPCHFHEDKSLEAIINSTRQDIWGEHFMQTHIRNMQITINTCILTHNIAIVVNPKR